MTDDGRVLVLLAALGITGAAAVRSSLPSGSRGSVRGGRKGPPDRCIVCGKPEEEGCRCPRRVLTSPVRLTGVLAGHPLVKQNLGPRDRDRPPLLRMTLLLETGSHGNVIVDNVITTGNLLHHPHAETRPPRKGDQVALVAWERRATPKDPQIQWSAYEGKVQVVERGSRSTVRGGRGAAKTGREIEREAIEVFVGDIEPMTPEQVRQWEYNDILVCPHGGTEFTVQGHMHIFWPPSEQVWSTMPVMGLHEYSYGEHFGPRWCQCEHADGTRAFFWPPDNLEFT